MKAVRLLPLLIVAGCASTGLINPPPVPVTRDPVNITVHRVESVVGAPLAMVFVIDGTDIVGLSNGQSYSFQLDPGQYVFGWRFGMNSCDQDVWLHPGRTIEMTFSNECNIPSVP